MTRTDKDRSYEIHDQSRRTPDAPPRWPKSPARYRHAIWYGPDRLRTRVACQTSIAEYRATGEVDTIVPIDQDRLSAGWHWC